MLMLRLPRRRASSMYHAASLSAMMPLRHADIIWLAYDAADYCRFTSFFTRVDIDGYAISPRCQRHASAQYYYHGAALLSAAPVLMP